MDKKRKIMILIASVLLLISGCQNKEVTPVESIETKNPSQINEGKPEQTNEVKDKSSPDVETDGNKDMDVSSEELPKETAEFSLYEIFPDTKDFTWYYDGALDYGSYETIVNIEETLTDEKTKYIYIEGENDDLSGGEAGDLSFVKKYKVTEQSIERVLEDTSLILLKTPLQKGNSWVQNRKDETSPKITIIDLTDTTITTELISTQNVEGTEKEYKATTTYEVGKGVVSKTIFYPGENEPYEFPISLSRTSQIPPDRFISRYIQPDKGLKKFYQHDDTWYKEITSNSMEWIDGEKNNIDDEKIVSQYKELLEKLSKEDIKSILIAKDVGRYYSIHMSKADLIIPLFENFYEETISKLQYELIETEALTYEEIEKIYKYDEKEKNFKIVSVYDYDDPLLVAKAIVLYENGVSVGYDEGFPLLCPDKDYVINNFASLVSDSMNDYLTLKQWQYRNTPLFSDFALTISWNDLADRIIKLEEFYKKYPDINEAKWAREEAKNLFELYVVPTGYLDNTRKFWNGILSEDLQGSYERFIDNYPDSSYMTTIEVIYDNLKQNNFMYNSELNNYFNEQGFKGKINESILKPMEEYEKQLADYKRIVLKAVKNQAKEEETLELITVETAEEFLRAIGSNRKILIKSGTYIIPYSFSSEFVNVNEGETTIKNVKNLVIEGQGEKPVTILSEAYGYVFSFPDAENITLINLRMGHLNEYCKAGVLKFGGENIRIDRCILFGCGEWGLTTSGVENMQVTNTLISDCTTQALQLYKSKNITFENCIFTRNGKNVVSIDDSDGVLLKEVDITNNGKDGYNTSLSIFNIIKSTNISVESCNIEENGTDKLTEGDSELTIKE